MSPPFSGRSAGLAAAITAILIYAGMFSVGRHGAARGLDGFDQTALRFGVSLVVLAPFAIAGFRGILGRLGPWRVLALLVLQGAVYSVVFLAALTFAPVTYGAALVPGLQPFIVLAWGAFLLGEKTSGRTLLGLSVCLVGCFAIIGGKTSEATPDTAIGIALFIMAAGMWGTYTFLLRLWRVRPMDALIIVATSSGALFLPPYIAVAGEGILDASWSAILIQAIYQGLLVGVLAVVLMPFAVARLGGVGVASLSPSMPVLATVIALVLLGEYPSATQWIGLGLVSGGLIVVQVPEAAFRRVMALRPRRSR